MAITQECCEQYWTSPGGNTPQSTNYTATCLQPRKLSKLDEPGHYWRSKDELISNVLLWTPAYGQAKAGRPARTYIQQLWEDTGCSPEDLPEEMNDREKWWERVRDIFASGMTWWWLRVGVCLRVIAMKRWFHTHSNSETGDLSSDAVLWHTKDTCFFLSLNYLQWIQSAYSKAPASGLYFLVIREGWFVESVHEDFIFRFILI